MRALSFAVVFAASGCGLIAGVRDLEIGSTTGDGGSADGGPPGNPATDGTLFVSPEGGDEAGDGSLTRPLKTIAKAIERAGATRTAIVLVTGKLGSATFGTSCTGGPPCDSTPIVVPATATGGVVLRGEGNVTVVGPGDAVFVVNVPGVGFENITIAPQKRAAANAGGHGIVFDAPPSSIPSAVTKVTFTGAAATATTAGTGTAIVARGGASPTLGPGIRVNGGFGGVLVGNDSVVRVAGDTTAPTEITGVGGPCIDVRDNAMVQVSGATLRNCAPGIRVATLAAGTGTTIEDVILDHPANTPDFSPALEAIGASKVSIARSSLTGDFYYGIRVGGTATVTIDTVTVTGLYYAASTHERGNIDAKGLVVRSSVYDGITCGGNGSIKLRSSSALSNGKNGVVVHYNCAVDLGTAAGAGNNVFNKTNARNGNAGLCVYSGHTIEAAGNTWGCGQTAGCTATGTPTRAPAPAGGFACEAALVDINVDPAATVTASMPTCCAN
jgi:hypothetical protein